MWVEGKKPSATREKRLGCVHGVQCARLQFRAVTIDKLSCLFGKTIPEEVLALPSPTRNELLQTVPVLRIRPARSDNKRPMTFEFRKLAQDVWPRVPSHKFFGQHGLPLNIEMECCREIGVEIIHRFSSRRSSSTGFSADSGKFLSHAKCLSQSGSGSGLGWPLVNVIGEPSGLMITTVLPWRAFWSQ